MSYTDLPYSEALSPKIVKGVIANTPASAGDALYVTIPSMASNNRHGPCPWTPHGTALPTAGTACLVAFDEADLAWVVAWIGGWS